MTLIEAVAEQVGIAVENAFAFQEVDSLNRRLAKKRLYLEDEIRTEAIVGDSPELLRALNRIKVVASNDSTVLILGETGTGKELIARVGAGRSSGSCRRPGHEAHNAPIAYAAAGNSQTGLV